MPARPLPRRTAALHRRIGARRRNDAGSMSLLVAVAIVGILLIIGLVVDGGGKLRALSHAEGVAQEAARAGGQAIDAGKALSGEGIEVDRNAAVAAARSYLDQAGVKGTVTVSEDGTSLEVTVTEQYTPIFLGGMSNWSVTGTGSANLIYRG